MDHTVFYSWQSDVDAKSTRYLIQDALKEVIKKLNASLDFEEASRLDQDTKGVSGSPEITNTILTKIDNCSIFVADVTSVAQTDKEKNVPNPNVLLELGYAYKAVPVSQIITVMNEAFGSASDGLPFDLAHRRWPIRYNLPSNAPSEVRKVEKGRLVSILFDAIMEVYKSGIFVRTESSDIVAVQPKWRSSCFLADGDILCKQPSLNNQESVDVLWHNSTQAFLRLIPCKPLKDMSQL